MKKLLGSTLALALFLPALANAELMKNLKLGGQLDVSAVSARNVIDYATRGTPPSNGTPNNDRIGSMYSRAMLKMDWDLLDDVHAKLTLVKGGLANAADQNRAYGSGAEHLNTVQNETFVQEAYVKVDKLFGFTDMTVGRQFYGEPGDLVVYYGPRDNYGLAVDAIDAARFDWNGEHLSVTGVAAKFGGQLAQNTGALRDGDLRGLVVSCNKNENVKGSAYIYNTVSHAAGALANDPRNGGIATGTGHNDFLYVAGVKANMTFGGGYMKAEFAKNFGSNRSQTTSNSGDSANYKGWALLLKGGYKLDLANAGLINPWAEFGYGSGRARSRENKNETFTAINTDYRPGAVYGRFDAGAGVTLGANTNGEASNGLSNRTIYGFGVHMTPAAFNKLTAGVQYYKFAFSRFATGVNASSPYSRNIGSEVDVTGEWKHSDNVTVKGTLGQFKPGAYIADVKGANATINPALMAAMDFSVKF